MLVSLNTLLQDRYLVVRMIAQGGMGAVYQATDKEHGKTVALKQSLVTDAHLRKAFDREARMLSRLRHPSLPVVSDFFNVGESQFLVMEFIPGEDLGTLLEHKGDRFVSAIVIPWVLRWADQLLDALQYLHTQPSPIIHRDIKPQNLKPTPRGDIMLLDFGLAKGAGDQTIHSTVRSVRAYTPDYAPLEQIQGTGTDVRSDLYALAATFYHLLTNHPPPDALTRVASVLSAQPDPLRSAHELNPNVAPLIAIVLHQALEQKMDDRFASAASMRKALHMAAKQSGKPITTTKETNNERKKTTNSSDRAMQTVVSSIPEGPTASPPPNPTPSSKEPMNSNPSPTEKGTPPTENGRRTITSITYPRLIVSQHGNAHFETIGDAIQHARPGTRILVRPGTYKEGIVINKTLEIIGDGPVSDIIIQSTGVNCIQMQTDYAVVRGITVRGRSGTVAREYPLFAVDIPQGRLVLEDCDISSETLAGIAVHGAESRPVIWRCTIHTCKGSGIFFYENSHGMVEECDIAYNTFAGIRVAQGSNPTIRQCTIHHGKQNGIYFYERSAGTVEECSIFKNDRAGIEIKQNSNPFIRWCKIHNQVNGYGVMVYDMGQGIMESCDIFGNYRAGIRIAQKGNPMIRRCKIHDENQRGVMIVENGLGLLEECDIFNNAKTGIMIGQESNPLIRKCAIHDCAEGGIFVWDKGEGRLEECNIFGNAHAGVETRQYGNPMIRRCTINQNTLMAVLVHKNGSGNVEHCDLSGNMRDAWYVEDGCVVVGKENRL